ncbi:MAG: bifunctional adenosylcobinamide kinase/adenosylcobinamide-phosphate guanylyltransferase [Candidatus Rokubacteria bacterium]|nr:bifunctional adenosylcobinamide kinase/adenosylcobinamide-phosphate guanylyltransferase [Candidatus Rokubacteria bacterium]
MARSHLILGGARSGKSRFAVESQPRQARVAFIATAQAGDGDMAARIARHRAERPRHWLTIEEPFDVLARLGDLAGRAEAAIVDCLTLWVANRLLRGDDDEAILRETEALAGAVKRAPLSVTLISNEVGDGVHPETAAGRRFRDLLGLVNQRLAAACDAVTLMVAGVPLVIKSTPEGSRDHAPQAP